MDWSGTGEKSVYELKYINKVLEICILNVILFYLKNHKSFLVLFQSL